MPAEKNDSFDFLNPDGQSPRASSETISPDIASESEEALRRGFRRLRFPDCLERAFLVHYSEKTIKQTRFALIVGIFLYSVFGIADALLIPSLTRQLLFIRFALVCPILVFTLLATFSKALREHLQAFLWISTMAAGLGIIAMTALDPTFGGKFYYSGLLLVIMFAFSFNGLRFWNSLSWAAATLLAYELVAVFVSRTSPSILFYNSLVIVSAIAIGAFSNYLLEYYVRRDFLNSIQLQHEKYLLEKTSEKLRRLSALDELTGIANRRSFEEALERELLRASRGSFPISLLLFDIDAFKAFNDNYGHRAGDDCLRRVAECLKTFARRPGDLAARYGGEEFAIILAATDLERGGHVAEKVRSAIEGLGILHGHSPAGGVITASGGVATLLPTGTEGKSWLIEAADRALYQAKAAGRNRIIVGPGQYALFPQRQESNDGNS